MKTASVKIAIALILIACLVSCAEKPESSSIQSSETTRKTVTAVITTSTSMANDDYPLGDMVNPYPLVLQKDGTFITEDSRLVLDNDFDFSREYKVGDTVIVTRTVTNVTDEDLYIDNVIGSVQLTEPGQILTYTGWDGSYFLKPGEPFELTSELVFEKSGKVILNVWSDFQTCHDGKFNYPDIVYYRSKPFNKYLIDVKE